MIFIAAGTQDGRELAGRLLKIGHPVIASVVSSYGEKLLKQYPGLIINDKPLDEEGLIEYLSENQVGLFVDASHPYAANVSQNAMNACRRLSIPYIRYERQSVPVAYKKVYAVTNYEEAAKKAGELGRNVFLTTGSRNVRAFITSPDLRDHEIVVRILPTADVLKEMESLGLTPKNIIALQGPFSTELNIALYKQYRADVIVTKNSGEIGGTDTKLEAAMALRLPVVMVDRPRIEYDKVVYTFDEVLRFVAEKLPGK